MDTRGHLARATGLSYRLLGDLERGTRDVSEGTLALVEQALGWVPGSARDVLAGGPPAVGASPAVLTGPTTARANEDRAPRSAIRALTDGYRIATEIIESGAEHHGTRLFEVLSAIGNTLLANPDSGLVEDANDKAADGDREPFRTAAPTVLRMALGEYLRQLRERGDLTGHDVAIALGCPAEFLTDLESGRAAFEEGLVRKLLDLYEVENPDLAAEIMKLAAEADRSGWWTHDNKALPRWFETYVGLERSADTIRTFESAYIPGLLQTRDYAHAVIGMSQGTSVVTPAQAREVADRVRIRMERQHILSRADPVRLWAIIDEKALYWIPRTREVPRPGIDQDLYRRQIHDIYRHQIEHLIAMSRNRHITLQILRRDSTRKELTLAFSLLRFGFQRSHRPDLVYIEHLSDAIYMDDPKDVEPYAALFDRLGVAALSPRASTIYLERLSKRLTDHPESLDAAREEIRPDP